MEPTLPDRGSYMDIGSSNGWFVFHMAERGFLSLGVEARQKSYLTSQLLTLHNRSLRVGFINLDIDTETVNLLPTVDVISCFSVFHHWVRIGGLGYATTLMETLSARCRHQLYFETGQSDERDQEWHTLLSFMGDDPKAWITDYLSAELGFTIVKPVGDAEAHDVGLHRHIFLAERAS